jgi:ketosteroid isomerase-like protein
MLDTTNPTDVVRAFFDAWTRKNKPAMEDLLTDDFHFSSPLDNHLDRNTFFERCWPGSEDISGIDLKRLIPDGHLVLVTYELTMKDGRKFRNTEAITLREAQVKEVEVYFGWDIPHKAPDGGFVDEYHVGGTADEAKKKEPAATR